jgi:hypothetical protein
MYMPTWPGLVGAVGAGGEDEVAGFQLAGRVDRGAFVDLLEGGPGEADVGGLVRHHDQAGAVVADRADIAPDVLFAQLLKCVGDRRDDLRGSAGGQGEPSRDLGCSGGGNVGAVVGDAVARGTGEGYDEVIGEVLPVRVGTGMAGVLDVLGCDGERERLPVRNLD